MFSLELQGTLRCGKPTQLRRLNHPPRQQTGKNLNQLLGVIQHDEATIPSYKSSAQTVSEAARGIERQSKRRSQSGDHLCFVTCIGERDKEWLAANPMHDGAGRKLQRAPGLADARWPLQGNEPRACDKQ